MTAIRKNSPFDENEMKWIVLNCGNSSAIEVRRKFILEFSVPRKRQHHLHAKQFSRVRDRFAKHGTIDAKVVATTSTTVTTDDNVQAVKTFFEKNPHSSITSAASVLNISPSSVYRIIRKKLKFKPYRIHKVQTLTQVHKQQRMEFCQWWHRQPDNFAQVVIWSDEKWFVRKTPPNRQNERYWALVHPHEFEEHQKQGGEKIMAWVGIVDGEILSVYWFKDENGNATNVNGESYGKMLNDHVFPRIKYKATRRQWWFQQDGATPHCTTANIEMLQAKFQGRLISRRAEVAWPSCSPDLNPLDFWFWGYCMQQIRKKQPENMQELCTIVEETCHNTPPEIIRRSVNIGRRVQLCLQCNGGQFQHLL
jgi:inhibitor of nuclear factor kappa-B kinase subunit alpha